jgi:hypothetical protein
MAQFSRQVDYTLSIMNLPSFSGIPSLSSISEQIADKIPDNMKTMSVTLRHMLLVSHACSGGARAASGPFDAGA